MICRNCSALIEDGLEKCPVCHKSPSKRGSKSGGKKAFVAGLVLVLLAAAVYLVCSNLDLVKEKVAALIPAFSPQTVETTATAAAETATQSSTRKSGETDEDFSLLKTEIVIKSLENDGKRIALHGTAQLKKSQLKALSQAEFSAFCKKRAENSSLAWLTLKCEDETGIVIEKGSAIAVYGKLDENDFIKEALGMILTDSSGQYVYIPSDGAACSVKVTEPETTTAAETKAAAATTERKTSAGKNVAKDSERVVFIEKGVKCYHKSSCKLLSKAKKSIAKTEAIEKGYTRCKKCKP